MNFKLKLENVYQTERNTFSRFNKIQSKGNEK